jgi:hypothetical protein
LGALQNGLLSGMIGSSGIGGSPAFGNIAITPSGDGGMSLLTPLHSMYANSANANNAVEGQGADKVKAEAEGDGTTPRRSGRVRTEKMRS